MLYELDRMAEERTLVHAGQETLDGFLGAQVELRDAGDRIRVQEAARIVSGFDCHNISLSPLAAPRAMLDRFRQAASGGYSLRCKNLLVTLVAGQLAFLARRFLQQFFNDCVGSDPF